MSKTQRSFDRATQSAVVKTALTFCMSSLACAVLSVSAAQDGVTGSSSTGTADVQIVKGDGVRISDLQNFNFGAGLTAPTAKQIDDICVHSTTGSYTILATSQGNATGGTQFRMVNATLNEHIRYYVQFRNDTSSQIGTNLFHNQVSATITGADQTSESCANATNNANTNARLILSVDAPSFDAATPATYKDVLTLTVAPI